MRPHTHRPAGTRTEIKETQIVDYVPQVGEYVHVHVTDPYDGLRAPGLIGRSGSAPERWLVESIELGYDLEVPGGTAHQGPLYNLRAETIGQTRQCAAYWLAPAN